MPAVTPPDVVYDEKHSAAEFPQGGDDLRSAREASDEGARSVTVLSGLSSAQRMRTWCHAQQAGKQLRAAVDASFPIDCPQMIFDRTETDRQLTSDHFVRQPRRYESRDLRFARAEIESLTALEHFYAQRCFHRDHDKARRSTRRCHPAD